MIWSWETPELRRARERVAARHAAMRRQLSTEKRKICVRRLRDALARVVQKRRLPLAANWQIERSRRRVAPVLVGPVGSRGPPRQYHGIQRIR